MERINRLWQEKSLVAVQWGQMCYNMGTLPQERGQLHSALDTTPFFYPKMCVPAMPVRGAFCSPWGCESGPTTGNRFDTHKNSKTTRSGS